MVAGPFGHSRLFVYITRGGLFRKRSCGHNMVQTPSEVALERIPGAVVPERVLPCFFAVHPEHSDKSPLHNPLQSLMDFRMVAHVPQQTHRVVNIYRRRRHVQIPDPDEGNGWLEMALEKAQQSGEPIELVIELVRLGPITLRNK